MGTQPLVLHGGRVLQTGATRPESLDVVIGPDGRIAALTPPAPIPRGVQALDLAERLVAPGLIDAHQHLDKALTRCDIPNPTGCAPQKMKPPRSKLRGITRKSIVCETPRFLTLFPLQGNLGASSEESPD